jgi:hypothetical protein
VVEEVDAVSSVLSGVEIEALSWSALLGELLESISLPRCTSEMLSSSSSSS